MDKKHLLRRSRAVGFAATFGLVIQLLTTREKKKFILVLISSFIASLANLLSAASLMPFIYLFSSYDSSAIVTPFRPINWLLESLGQKQLLYIAGMCVVSLYLFKTLLVMDNMYRISIFTGRLEERLSSELINRIVNSPIDWLSKQNNDVLRDVALARTSEWARGCIRELIRIFGNIAFIVMALVTLIYVNPIEGPIVLVVLGIAMLAILKVSKAKIKDVGEDKRIAGRASLIYASEAISGGRELRINNTSDVFLRYFDQSKKAFTRSEVTSRLLINLPRQVSELAGVSGIVLLGLLLIASGASLAYINATLLLFAVVLARSLPIISELTSSITFFYWQSSQIKELVDFINETNEFNTKKIVRAFGFKGSWERLDLENVCYSYKQSKMSVLDDLSLSISRGSKACFVGKSGSGKSTLIDIICGLGAPSSGFIKVDGKVIDKSTVASWQDEIAYVPQSPCLIDGTLRDNVLFGLKPQDYSDVAILRSLYDSGFLDELSLDTSRLDILIGDGGSQVSGGQRQRIAIARALIRRKSLLILDESTSAVDNVTAQRILNRLLGIHGLTLILVVHNMNYAKSCDIIYLLQDGKIAASGTYSSLVQFSSQFNDFLSPS
jgi:ABC-type bacteriocin/lantibiotic exporter with double-glycine peptidase domain